MSKQAAPQGKARTLIALLRGVNVGGKNRLAMKDFAAACESVGCANVRTYIQSGNAVFEVAPAAQAGLAEALSQVLLKRHGLKVPVILRSAAEWEKAIQANPFSSEGPEGERTYVGFFSRPVPKAEAAALKPPCSPGEKAVISGSELYLLIPKGMATTKLTNAYFDGALKNTVTMRNLRTLMALRELAKEGAANSEKLSGR